MPYNKEPKRQELLRLMPWLFDDCESKVLQFINLCIYPQKFELLYDTLRTQDRISADNYESVKGTITGLLVLTHRQHAESKISVDAYVIDFIRFIRSDKKPDPVRFLLSMRVYFPRFLLAVGLQTSFGVDWRTLVTEVLSLENKPQLKSYHSLFGNKYLRTLVHAYIVWKNYRDTHDPDYEEGTNDLLTLLDKYSKLKTNDGRESTQALFEALQSNLPSWSVDARKKAAWAIDSAQDGYEMINRQFSDWKYKQVQG
jgi:hypothetical protein